MDIPKSGAGKSKVPGLITAASREQALAHKFLQIASMSGVTPIEVVSAAAIVIANAMTQLPESVRAQVLENLAAGLRADVLGEKQIISAPLTII